MTEPTKNIQNLVLICAGITVVAFGMASRDSVVSATPGPSHVIVDNAAIPVTGTVSLEAGTEVAIAGTPSVTIGNTPANPAVVRDTDAHARQPFQQRAFLSMDDGSFASNIVEYAVPAGKRLVIEHIDAIFGMPNGGIPTAFVTGSVAGSGTTVTTAAVKQGAANATLDQWIFSGPTLVYGDGDTSVAVQYGRNIGVGFSNCLITISGYFIDL